MKTMQMTRRILATALTAVILLSFVGCNSQTGGASDRTPDHSNGSDNTPDSGEAAIYTLPAGAASEYELYKTVANCLRNGAHFDDIKDVLDPNLILVFSSKQHRDPADIFTLGMQYDAACALMAKLFDIASSLDVPKDPNGDPDWDLIDYAVFQKEFPEDLQAQIDDNYEEFTWFIKNYVLEVIEYGLLNGGETPSWFQEDMGDKSEDELVIAEYDEYSHWDKDLYNNFPRVYRMDFGEYLDGNTLYTIRIMYTKIGDRCYYLGMSQEGVGATGG